MRVAREAKGLSLEDVAAQTRIPQRHLASIETGDWEHLPAPTYTIGFAKNYAGAVGLDRTEIGNQLREEMGGQRFASTPNDVFEPADPRADHAQVAGARGDRRGDRADRADELAQPPLARSDRPASDGETQYGSARACAQAAAPPAASPAAAQGPVVLTATAPVWLQVSEKGGANLFSGMLQPGQTYAVPPTATAPVLKTGKPEALQDNVGNAVAPPVGPPATTVTNVSLLPRGSA